MNKAIVLICVLALMLCNGCSVFYVMKQGAYQLSLLHGAEPIEMVLRDPSLDGKQRKKLELIVDVRRFAEEHLKLEAHKNYKDVNITWDKTIHTVSGSRALKFQPYLWWFPIIGSVPYKGYFNEADAHEEKTRLDKLGYETQMRPIHGYSTLGFFADPVWPAMLLMHDHALVELIIHELTHATVYIPNQTPFNETFANYVGKHGARAYLAHRFGKDSDAVVSFDRYEDNLKRYYLFFQELYSELNGIYDKELSLDDKSAAKKQCYADAKARYQDLVRDKKVPAMDFDDVNNAFLLSFKNYNEDFSVFAKLMTLVGDDFARFTDEVNYYARTGAPFLSLEERVRDLERKR